MEKARANGLVELLLGLWQGAFRLTRAFAYISTGRVKRSTGQKCKHIRGHMEPEGRTPQTAVNSNRQDSIFSQVMQLPLVRLTPADEFIRRGGVYFMAHRFMPYVIKIGCSVDIVRRMRAHSARLHKKAGVKTPDIWGLPTMYLASSADERTLYQQEQCLHGYFQSCHLADEWFDRNAVLMTLKVWYPANREIIEEYEETVKAIPFGWRVEKS